MELDAPTSHTPRNKTRFLVWTVLNSLTTLILSVLYIIMAIYLRKYLRISPVWAMILSLCGIYSIVSLFITSKEMEYRKKYPFILIHVSSAYLTLFLSLFQLLFLIFQMIYVRDFLWYSWGPSLFLHIFSIVAALLVVGVSFVNITTMKDMFGTQMLKRSFVIFGPIVTLFFLLMIPFDLIFDLSPSSLIYTSTLSTSSSPFLIVLLVVLLAGMLVLSFIIFALVTASEKTPRKSRLALILSLIVAGAVGIFTLVMFFVGMFKRNTAYHAVNSVILGSSRVNVMSRFIIALDLLYVASVLLLLVLSTHLNHTTTSTIYGKRAVLFQVAKKDILKSLPSTDSLTDSSLQKAAQDDSLPLDRLNMEGEPKEEPKEKKGGIHVPLPTFLSTPSKKAAENVVEDDLAFDDEPVEIESQPPKQQEAYEPIEDDNLIDLTP